MVLYPKKDGDLSLFMGWLTNTHTRRWHTKKGTVGQAHLYQGRYKSFICQKDNYFLTLARYVERNAKKANLVQKAENWEWSSVWKRESGTPKQKKMLSSWPVPKPKNYLRWLNTSQTKEEEDVIEKSIAKNIPLGNEIWTDKVIKKFSLEQTLRGVGRPKKNGG